MSKTIDKAYFSLILTPEEMEFLRQLVNAEGVTVRIQHAKIAASLYDTITTATPIQPAV